MKQKVEGGIARDAESLLFPVKIREWDLCLAVVLIPCWRCRGAATGLCRINPSARPPDHHGI